MLRSQCLTCTFRASCCSARLSRAQVPAFAGSSVRDRDQGNDIYVSTFGHAHSRAQPLAWPVTLSAVGGRDRIWCCAYIPLYIESPASGGPIMYATPTVIINKPYAVARFSIPSNVRVIGPHMTHVPPEYNPSSNPYVN